MTDTFYGAGIVTRADEQPSTNFQKVKQFMLAFEQEVPDHAQLPDKKIEALRYELIREELAEFKDALDNQDLVEAADALTDLLYVVYGAGLAFGIDLDKCFAEVHRSNMTKLDENGKVLRREDGKVMKSPLFEPPQLERIVFGD